MKNFKMDIKRYSNGSRKKGIVNFFLNPNFHCVTNYRIAHFFYSKCKFNIIPKLIMYFNRVIYSVDIDYRAEISGGFKLVHGIGTVIGSNVVIEENVTVYQNVTLGGNMKKYGEFNGKTITQPHICKNATLYASALVLGGVVVGEKAEIGSNTVVTNDVPSNMVTYKKCKSVIYDKRERN